MRVTCLAAIAAIAALLATPTLAQQSPGPHSELAQLPPPFGAPGPILPGLSHCSPQHQRLLKLQMEGMKQLQRLSRGQGETLCATLEGADVQGVDKLIDPKALQRFLTPDQRELLEAFGIDVSKVDVAKIMRRLGIDLSQIDLRQLTHQCRQSRGELERFATAEIARVERQMLRCEDRI